MKATPQVVHDAWLVQYHHELNSAIAEISRSAPELAHLICDAALRGRKIRSALALEFMRSVGWRVPSTGRRAMMLDLARVELIHAASCIMDDIIDGDTMRRGLPSYHARNGMPQAILASLMMYALSMRGSHPQIDDLYQRTMQGMISGEAWDAFLAAGHDRLPSDLKYRYLEKSAASFSATHWVVDFHIKPNRAPAPSATMFGVFWGELYQACNDYYDTFEISPTVRGKAEDDVLITLSIPLCYLIQQDPSVRALIGTRVARSELVRLRELMVTHGIKAKCRRFIRSTKKRLKRFMEAMPDAARLAAHMEQIDSVQFWSYKYSP